MSEDRFKFRFWIPGSKSLHYDAFGFDTHNGTAMGRPDWVIMQSTGLRDKHGKLIFEGDIIEDKEVGEHALVRSLQDICLTLANRIPGEGYDLSEVWIQFPERYEIIGNLYENPEILK